MKSPTPLFVPIIGYGIFLSFSLATAPFLMLISLKKEKKGGIYELEVYCSNLMEFEEIS